MDLLRRRWQYILVLLGVVVIVPLLEGCRQPDFGKPTNAPNVAAPGAAGGAPGLPAKKGGGVQPPGV